MSKAVARIRELKEPVYNRQPTESPESWVKFQYYRDIGPQRTLKIVAIQYNCSPRSIDHLSAKWRWSDRIEVWELRLDKIRQQTSEDDARSMALRHATLGKMAVEKAEEALVHLDSKEMSVGEATRLMEAGVKVERLSRGESTQNVAVRVEHFLLAVVERALGSLPEDIRSVAIDRVQQELVIEAEKLEQEGE